MAHSQILTPHTSHTSQAHDWEGAAVAGLGSDGRGAGGSGGGVDVSYRLFTLDERSAAPLAVAVRPDIDMIEEWELGARAWEKEGCHLILSLSSTAPPFLRRC